MNLLSDTIPTNTSFRSFIRQKEFWIIVFIGAVVGLADMTTYSSGDIRPHREFFYSLVSQKFSLHTDEGLNTYLATYLWFLGPFIAAGHYFSWETKMLLIKTPELLAFIGNLVFLGMFYQRKWWLLPSIYAILQVSYGYVANGGRYECCLLFFFLLGLYFFSKSRYILSGLIIGLSIFKYYTFPALAILAGILLIKKEFRSFLLFVGSMIAINSPALLLFLLTPSSGTYITELVTEGYKTHHSGYIRNHHILYPLSAISPEFTFWYCKHGIWKWFLPPCFLLSLSLFHFKRITLLESILIAMFPVAFLWHGETKILFFLVIFSLALKKYLEQAWAQISLCLATLEVYFFIRIYGFESLERPTNIPIESILFLRYWFFFCFCYFLYIILIKPKSHHLVDTNA